jgi:uncharacterized protein (TIGR00369 family)
MSAVGTEVVLVEAGKVHLRIASRPDLLQFSGAFHGGVIAGLADHAAGGAVTTLLPPGRIGVTIELKVNFLSPADGVAIIARAEALKVARVVGVAKVEVVTDQDGAERTCAFATVTLRAIDLHREQGSG